MLVEEGGVHIHVGVEVGDENMALVVGQYVAVVEHMGLDGKDQHLPELDNTVRDVVGAVAGTAQLTGC